MNSRRATGSPRRAAAALCLFAALLLSSTGPLSAAEFILLAGPGFNDATPVDPAPGNPGTTLGEQRRLVMARAFEILGATLPGDVPIRVQAQFVAQPCTAGGGVLASASPFRFIANPAGAPLADTFYPIALADQLAGEDLFPGEPDLRVNINALLDSDPNCLGGDGWYYGLDHNEGPAADLLTTILHELTHGLGFTNRSNSQSGAFPIGLPDITSRFIFDTEAQMHWDDMTPGERLASQVNDPNVVFDGEEVTQLAAKFLEAQVGVQVDSPAPLAGAYAGLPALFGPRLSQNGVGGPVIVVDDGVQPLASDGCEGPFVNADLVAGRIALIRRGNCSFVQKVLNAQAAGAAAVIVANNAPGLIFMAGADGAAVEIPALMIMQADGDALEAAVDVEAGMSALAGLFFGTNQGMMRLHAPSTFQGGSSISHWTPAAFPDLSMEPSTSPSLTDDLDLTIAFLRDIGWRTVEESPRPPRNRSESRRPRSRP